MRNKVLLLSLSLLLPICSSSQTTYPRLINDSLIVITPTQLKQTNKIFLEYQVLKEKELEYTKQISLYQDIVKSCNETANMQDSLINVLEDKTQDYYYENKNLTDQISYYKNKCKSRLSLAIGGITIGVLGLIFCLIR